MKKAGFVKVLSAPHASLGKPADANTSQKAYHGRGPVTGASWGGAGIVEDCNNVAAAVLQVEQRRRALPSQLGINDGDERGGKGGHCCKSGESCEPNWASCGLGLERY